MGGAWADPESKVYRLASSSERRPDQAHSHRVMRCPCGSGLAREGMHRRSDCLNKSCTTFDI